MLVASQDQPTFLVIVMFAHPRLIAALNGGMLAVNGAIQLCKFPRSEQVEQFSRSREERAMNTVICQAMHSQREKPVATLP